MHDPGFEEFIMLERMCPGLQIRCDLTQQMSVEFKPFTQPKATMLTLTLVLPAEGLLHW